MTVSNITPNEFMCRSVKDIYLGSETTSAKRLMGWSVCRYLSVELDDNFLLSGVLRV
jgi:hypothetical protein